MNNAVQGQIVKRLLQRESRLNDQLEVTERSLMDGLMMMPDDSEEALLLDDRAMELARKLTDIDEVLRVLGAR